MVEAAFKAQREFLVIASKSKKPADKDLQSLLLPLSNKISEIQDFREKNRRSIYFNHLSAISESIPALGWVAVVSAYLIIAILLTCLPIQHIIHYYISSVNDKS